MRWVEVIFLALASLGAADENDFCHFEEGSYYTRAEVMECFSTIPLDASVKAQTLDVLNKTKELYAFVDVAQDSPDPNLPLQVEIQTRLLEIAATNYQTAYEFHDDLRELYTGLGDAHTQYYRPTCFQNFLIRQPIPPSSYIEDGVNKIFVSRYMSADLVYHFKHYYDITELIGAEILTVDGVPAYNYFQYYADHHVGISKDPSTRFHLAMNQPQPQPTFDAASPSYWAVRTKRNPLPERASVKYTFKKTDGTIEDLEFLWTYQALKKYDGEDEFKADYYNSGDFDFSNMEKLTSEKLEEAATFPRHNIPNLLPRLKPESSDDYELLVNTDDVYFWALNDSQTLVMYLDTMLPETTLKTYQAINEGITMAAERNLTRLIMDFTGNGGGSICFGRTLLAYFQDQEGATNWGPQDLPLSPLQANLTTTAVKDDVSDTVWSPGFYKDQDGNAVPNSDISVIMPGVPHVRGGQLRNYSNLVHIDKCGFWGNFINPAKDFKPKDILLLTHGFCGSTCALTANHAALYDNIRTVVAGGRADRPQQQYTSFPGLQVLDDIYFYQQFEELGFDTTPQLPQKDDVIPRQLPTTASYRYCIREIYPPTIVTDPENTQPMEFTFQAATYKVDDTMESAEDPQTLWYRILPLFDEA